ncbi:MAG: hypothetical protein KDD60_03860, partial [Bdellovibrionales bacterium]|nr:hypothetical protein [Bdellovibrionales bacterium]
LYAIAVGDFSNDGVLDFATANGTQNVAGILLGGSREGINPLLPFSLQSMADARQAIPVFERKRDQLIAQRGAIGAAQSRLQVGINNLFSARENYLSAEAQIRDADVAQSAAELARLGILQEAATAVLAQTNQAPAISLSLLLG